MEMAQNFDAVLAKLRHLDYVSVKILERNSLLNFITADTILSAWRMKHFIETGVASCFQTFFFIERTR
jgi:hypothetical protein